MAISGQQQEVDKDSKRRNEGQTTHLHSLVEVLTNEVPKLMNKILRLVGS